MNHTDINLATLMTIYSMQGNELERDESNLMEMLLHRRNDI